MICKDNGTPIHIFVSLRRLHTHACEWLWKLLDMISYSLRLRLSSRKLSNFFFGHLREGLGPSPWIFIYKYQNDYRRNPLIERMGRDYKIIRKSMYCLTVED